MYLDTREGLGECDVTKTSSAPGPGRDPIGSEGDLCRLLVADEMTGRFLDWEGYSNRRINPKQAVSRFRQFKDSDCYDAYLNRCRAFAALQTITPIQLNLLPPELRGTAVEILTRLGILRSIPRPQTPTAQTLTSPKMRTNLSGWGGFGQHVRLPPTTPAPPRAFDPFKAAKEAAEKIVPIRPETPEERLNRILREPVPTLPRGRSFKEWLDGKMAERRVPKWLRDSIWKSFFDKNWGLLSNLLGTAGFGGGIKESIVETARAAGEIKAR
jgi:hypothetical protein